MMTIRVPLEADVEARIEIVDGAVDVHLYRRDSRDPYKGFQRTDAGFRLRPHLATIVAEAITRAARRAAEEKVWALPASGEKR